jgi:hypothetical protein
MLKMVDLPEAQEYRPTGLRTRVARSIGGSRELPSSIKIYIVLPKVTCNVHHHLHRTSYHPAQLISQVA